MTCPKCQSRMMYDSPLRFYASTLDGSDLLHSLAWHCLFCGTYLDRVILENRRKQAAELQAA